MEFYNSYKPQIDDTIYLDESVINDVNLFAFDEIYNPKILNKKDVIKVVGKEEHYLQRRFG